MTTFQADCSDLHRLAHHLPRYTFPFDAKQIEKNGIYLLFEKDELGHEGQRIARVGTHTGNNQLRSRLQQHFIQENKDRSIFRKNIGKCLLNRANDPYLDVWNIDFTTRASKTTNGHLINAAHQAQIEQEVSDYIQSRFSFVMLPVEEKEDRLYLESRIVSTLSHCSECKPSDNWLGMDSPNEKIRRSGLWQVNELYKEPLDTTDLKRMEGLANGAD